MSKEREATGKLVEVISNIEARIQHGLQEMLAAQGELAALRGFLTKGLTMTGGETLSAATPTPPVEITGTMSVSEPTPTVAGPTEATSAKDLGYERRQVSHPMPEHITKTFSQEDSIRFLSVADRNLKPAIIMADRLNLYGSLFVDVGGPNPYLRSFAEVEALLSHQLEMAIREDQLNRQLAINNAQPQPTQPASTPTVLVHETSTDRIELTPPSAARIVGEPSYALHGSNLHRVLCKYLAPTVCVAGKGPIQPSSSANGLKHYSDSMENPTRDMLHWPTGFYTGANGETQFKVNTDHFVAVAFNLQNPKGALGVFEAKDPCFHLQDEQGIRRVSAVLEAALQQLTLKY